MSDLTRLASMLYRCGLSGLVVTLPENVGALSGIFSTGAVNHPDTHRVILIFTCDAPEEPIVITAASDADEVLDMTLTPSEVVTFGTFYRDLDKNVSLTDDETRLLSFRHVGDDAASAVRHILGDLGLLGQSLGIDASARKAALTAQLDTAAEWVCCIDELLELRAVKTEAEQGSLAASADAAQAGVDSAALCAAEGATETELVTAVETAMVRLGARPGFTNVRAGRSALFARRPPGIRSIEQGEPIWYDVGCRLNGYWSDIAGTMVLGRPSAWVAQAHACVRAGVLAAFDAARPGMSGGELFDLTVAQVRRRGLPDYHRHHVGHGIGTAVYEPVIISPGQNALLQEGVVVNIEAPYYLVGKGAVHVEFPFVVAATGNRPLLSLDTTRLRILEPTGT